MLNQEYPDLEVIVVGDGAQADTRKLLEGFSDSRLKYYEIEHSGRPAIPRNFGMAKAAGEYIAFCDDDDIWMPQKLSLQIAKISNDKEIGLVYTKCILKNGERIRIVPYKNREGFIFKELFLSFDFIAASTVLIKKEVIDRIGNFDEDVRLKAVEDFDLWLRIAMQYKIGFIDKPLVIHREGVDSLTKGLLIKIKRHHIVPCKFYKKRYVGIGLFIRKAFIILFKSIFDLIHYNRILDILFLKDRESS